MSHQTKTPRQKQGDDLVPLVVRMPKELRKIIEDHAMSARCSIAEIVRIALDAYFFADRRS